MKKWRGPFLRSKDGYKYVLSAICLASRYLEAIPLKNVRAETVVEGLVEIFRTGVLLQILTDQGLQFVGKLMKQLYLKLNIDKLQTTPYHPQLNGYIERWHGTLVPMLKRILQDKLDRVQQVKYVLFACRSAPNRDSGLSPFEIVFGRHVRGPLELLHDMWETEEKTSVNVCGWVKELQTRLEVLQDPGDMVLVRIPGLSGKLEDSWDGPYKVEKHLNEVTYTLNVPNFQSKEKTVHINNLKPWVECIGKVLRKVALAEETMDLKDTLELVGDSLLQNRQAEICEILESYQIHMDRPRQLYMR